MSEQLVVLPKKSVRLTRKELELLATVIHRINANLITPLTAAEDRTLVRMHHLLWDRTNQRRPERHRYPDEPAVQAHPDLQEGVPIQ
jgi:hypothetical protein